MCFFRRWRLLDFRLLPHVGKDTFIITGFEEILQQLEESQVSKSIDRLIDFSYCKFRLQCQQ